jgi:predicted nucleotidyltransferase
MQIPQDEFRTPIRALLTELQAVFDQLVGVIVFGSVARGEADRASDIDVLVIADGETVDVRRTAHEVRQAIESQRFDGERYTFQVMAESVDSAKNYGEKLQTIFSEGIVLFETNELEQVREAVFDG